MPHGRDRLRELLDAVLDEDNPTLSSMAADAYSSPFHFARSLSREAGEGPVAMRRRVLLERAAWQLADGTTVTDAAFAAGYESVEGFSRAFTRAYGVAPSRLVPSTGHWLPAPNGIHFHPPFSLWISGADAGLDPISGVLTEHDVADTGELLRVASTVPDDELRRPLRPGQVVLPWDGVEESLLGVLGAVVWSKQVWTAAIDGHEAPPRPDTGIGDLIEHHERVGAHWLATLRRLDRERRWNDRLVDALCEPPESFVMAGVVAHVITFSAHRRQLARRLLAELGHPVGTGDPLEWLSRPHRRPPPDPTVAPDPTDATDPIRTETP